MADKKLVMGYWDCPYCNTKGIPGTQRNCPNCQNPRGKDTKFYMNKAEKKYLSEEEAKTKGQGADWQCEYCGAFNSALTNECSGCGSIRESSNQDYFQVREEEEKKAAQKEQEIENITGNHHNRSPYQDSDIADKTIRKNAASKNNRKKLSSERLWLSSSPSSSLLYQKQKRFMWMRSNGRLLLTLKNTRR